CGPAQGVPTQPGRSGHADRHVDGPGPRWSDPLGRCRAAGDTGALQRASAGGGPLTPPHTTKPPPSRCSETVVSVRGGSAGAAGAGLAALERAALVLGESAPDAGILAGLEGPLETGVDDLAATADLLGL